nr:MAG TPA: transcriptional regulator NrdR [Caudoviricetes sp.]
MNVMNCPICNCPDFGVVNTRPHYGNRIMRRRKCGNCGARYTTMEEIVKDQKIDPYSYVREEFMGKFTG